MGDCWRAPLTNCGKFSLEKARVSQCLKSEDTNECRLNARIETKNEEEENIIIKNPLDGVDQQLREISNNFQPLFLN
jgi:hypothetical protein